LYLLLHCHNHTAGAASQYGSGSTKWCGFVRLRCSNIKKKKKTVKWIPVKQREQSSRRWEECNNILSRIYIINNEVFPM
jgi:hypothetical protein